MTTSSPDGAPIWAPLLRRAAEHPNDTAFWFIKNAAVTTVTSRQLADGARRYAAALHRLGVQRRDIVIILLDHTVDQYFAFVGAMLAGAVPSFMPPLTSRQIPSVYWSSHAALFDRIKPRALVIGAERDRQLRQYITVADLPSLTPEDVVGAFPDFADEPKVAADDIAFLQHSSGTTQLKKGVRLSHRAVLAQVAAYAAELQIDERDRIASWLPLYHDMGLIACFIMPLVLGTPVVALDPFEWVMRPELLLQAIEEYRCTLTWQPNFAFHHLVRTRQTGTRYDLHSLRAWIDCSEPCRASTFDLFAAAFADCGVAADRLQVCYAMAETVFAVSQTSLGRPVHRMRVDRKALHSLRRVVPARPGEPVLELLSAGRALPGLSVNIIDDSGEMLPTGGVGEITISGDFVFSGYHRLPRQTAAKLQAGRYRSGDFGFMWEGQLYVLGRLDDLIIVNGRNFLCHEVEHIVTNLPGLKAGRSVLFSVDQANAGTQVAVLVSECDLPEDAARMELKRRVRQTVLSECDLSLHDIYLAPLGWLVKTTSGKISRYDNRAKYLAMRAAAVDGSA